LVPNEFEKPSFDVFTPIISGEPCFGETPTPLHFGENSWPMTLIKRVAVMMPLAFQIREGIYIVVVF